MKRRSGGLKIALVGLVGLVFSGMVSFTSVWMDSRGARIARAAPDRSAAQSRLDSLVAAIEQFRSETDEWPESLAALREEWEGGLEIEDPMAAPDPVTGRTRPFVYSADASGEGYTLFSSGRDGRAGTRDDVLPAFSGMDPAVLGWHAPRPANS
jgi:hypothetical protein